jgi:hypothetical protein
MADIYFSGQGKVYVGDRDSSGNTSVFRDLGNVPALRITLETDVLEHKESVTGNRLTDLRLTRERRARIAMTLENFSKANLMMLLYGTSSTVSAGSATNESLPAGIAVGDIVPLAHPLVSSVVITDSTGTPLTLTVGTNYTVDANSGMLTFVLVTGFVQPFKAAYSYAAADLVQFFKASAKERFLKFAGLNTASQPTANKPVIVEIYRFISDPVGNLDLINDELAQFEIEGSVLYDSTRDADALLGGFGRVLQGQ